jgi:hypothetical protein
MLLGKLPKPTDYLVRYNQVFVKTEFVITEFDCTGIPRYSRGLRSGNQNRGYNKGALLWLKGVYLKQFI